MCWDIKLNEGRTQHNKRQTITETTKMDSKNKRGQEQHKFERTRTERETQGQLGTGVWKKQKERGGQQEHVLGA